MSDQLRRVATLLVAIVLTWMSFHFLPHHGAAVSMGYVESPCPDVRQLAALAARKHRREFDLLSADDQVAELLAATDSLIDTGVLSERHAWLLNTEQMPFVPSDSLDAWAKSHSSPPPMSRPKVLINYGGGSKFESLAKRNAESALKVGGFDKAWVHSKHNVSRQYSERHADILTLKRGAGYWLWKPYVILRTLISPSIAWNSMIMYCDAGSSLISSAIPIFQMLSNSDEFLFAFTLPGLKEVNWTKGDIFSRLIPGDRGKEFTAQVKESGQIRGGFQFYKKTPAALVFLIQLLSYAQDKQLITDDASKVPNDERFRENRHDQSVFSVLFKVWGLTPHCDLTQHGHAHCSDQFPDDLGKYPQVVDHHRGKS